MPRTRSATRAAAVGEADVNSQPTSERGRGRGRGGGRGRGRGNGNPRDSASTPVSQSTPGSPTQDPVDELVSPGPVTTPAPTLRKGRRPVASVTTRSVNGKGKAPEVLPNGDDHSSDDDFEPIPPPSRSSVARKLSTEVPSTSKPSNGKRKAAESDSKDSEASDEYFPSSEVNDDDDDDSEYKPDSDDEALASKRPRKSAVIVKMLDRAAANSEQHSVAGPSQPQAKEEESEGSNELSEVGELSNSEEEGEAPGRRRRQPRGTRPKKPKTIPMAERLLLNHPELATVWAELGSTPISKTDQISQPEDIRLKLLPFQLEGVSWLQNQELSQFNGGILADEMGMGKTIQLISLLVTRRDVKPNLILTPTVAILQWLAEIKERVAPDVLSVCVYHGQNRETSAEALASHDVVLSTYAIVEGGYRKQQYGFKRKGALVKEKSLIHSIKWGRVILDEAHSIKDRSCSTAKAVFSLDCRYKWSLTGTPLQNRVGELYSLIRFLNSDPFSYYFCKSCPCKSIKWSFSDHRHCDYCGHISHQHFCWWNMEILKPIQKYGGSGDGLIAFQKLGVLLDRIMLRRTKVERADDLGLPPRVVTVRKDLFNEAEEELYESLYSDSKRQFSTYVAANTVLNNYASIFSLLSRMRMTVNHPDLVLTKMNQKGTNSENLVCGICQEPAEDAVISKCKHLFCREDVREYMVSAPDDKSCTCPVCFRPLSIDLTQPEYVGKSGASDSARLSVVNYIDMSQWRSSTKIEALVEELTALQRDDATMKSIVFSQFVAFLDLIQWRLSRAGFTLVRLDGRMTPQARDNVIKSFTTDPAVTVFLVSLKAGGVALNLTEASRVFILDPWWNPAAEDQAFDRIHRLGQTRPIKITRLIIENSIESRILQLQEKKKMLFQSTVGKDIDALAKLSAEDFQFLFTM